MVAVNKLQLAPPYPVEQSLKRLGQNLRIARVRRRWSAAEVAERIGTGTRAVLDAEKGKPTTGFVVYAALLWLYNSLDQMKEVGAPEHDIEGLALERSRDLKRVRKNKSLSNDF